MRTFLDGWIENLFLIISMFCLCMMPSTVFAGQGGDTEQPEFAFGVIADVQYCDCEPFETRYYRASLQKLTDCVNHLNARDLTFIIQLGDFIDRDFGSFAAVLPIYQKLKAPSYHVLGNHDFSVTPEEKENIFEALDLQQGFYDFSYHGWRFIVLDGNDLSLYALTETDEKYTEAHTMYQEFSEQGRLNAQTWNGGLSAQQMTWLKDTLDQATEKGENTILFCHFPVYPRPDIHNLWNDSELTGLLESYPTVVAYLNGHNHAGNYEVNKGIHYLTLQAMVETPDQNAYAIIEVYQNYLKILGQGREPDRMLKIRH